MSERPLPLTIAAAIEAIEGIAALGFGLFVGWETIVGSPVDPATAIGVTVLALLGGAGMLAVARGLLARLRWSRSPAVVTQLFALPVAWSLIHSEQYAFGVPLGVLGTVALALMLSRGGHEGLLGD